MLSQIKTFRFRVKSNKGFLNEKASKVNTIFNYCNYTQKQAVMRGRSWLSGFQLNALTAGSSSIIGLHSGCINAVCEQFAKSIRQHKKPWLKWRTSKHTGWVPIKGRDLKVKDDYFIWNGKKFRVFKSRELPISANIKDGTCFSQDSRGRWYINVVVECAIESKLNTNNSVGIDLGLKTFASLSNGEKIEGPKSTYIYADKLAKAQRANKKHTVKKLYDKIKNTRKDFLHKLSSRLCKDFNYIYVGDIQVLPLTKTNLAKSVLDAGWSYFRHMLSYKSVMNGGKYVEVSEYFTTQICSSCGDKPSSRPKGITSLGIREWVCSSCGEVHDRDINAAKNILRFGQESPVVGTL